MTELIKFTPIVVLETFEGDLFFTDAPIEQVAEMLNTKKFVMLNGEGVACTSIKNFYRDVCGFSELTRWQLKELMAWKKRYLETKMAAPTDELIIKKITRVKNGEKLSIN